VIKWIIVLLLVFPITVFAKGNHKLSRPVTDLTEERSIHFTLESDIYRDTTYFSPLISYGWDGWQIGLTSQNILVAGVGGSQNFENDTYLNLSKTFKINEWYKTTIGTQNGFVIPGPISKDEWHKFYFQDNDFELIDGWLTVHGGPYYVNSALSTTTNAVGYLTGAQVILIPHTLRLNLDYYSGHSNVSGAVAQLEYRMFSHLNTFIGVGVPERDSGNEFYGLLGFTLSEHFFKQ
jgi:hypothetical protein